MATTLSRGSSRASRAPPQGQTTPSQPSPTPAARPSSSSSSSVSSYLAMVELKQRILAALSKLSDRDTHQIAVDDLEKVIRTLPSDGVPMLLSSLLHDPPCVDPSTRQSPVTARRECLRLLALLCTTHPEPASAHLPKIISHVVRRVKDSSSDTSVRDACRDAVGSLSSLYLRANGDSPSENYASVVSLFVKPFFEAMGEQNKSVQAGAAACLAKLVECARDGEGGQQSSAVAAAAFQKLCPRICKFLGGHSFLAKGALLSVVSSLSQVGAITPQAMPPLLQSIRECLENSDWATRKSAADTLCVLASHSSHLIGDNATSIVTALESCRFDKVKPVRDSMTEALLIWRKVTGKGEDEEQKECKSSESTDLGEKLDITKTYPSDGKSDISVKDSSSSSPPASDSLSKTKGVGIPERAVVLLKKKAPSLTDKELNPEFFQKLETRSSDDLPVEVVVPRRCLQSSHSHGDEEQELGDDNSGVVECHDGKPCYDSNDIHGSINANFHNIGKRKVFNKMQDSDESARDKLTEPRAFRGRDSQARSLDMEDRVEISLKDSSGSRSGFSRIDGHSESFMNNKGNWLAIQRQLSLLERQQASLMNMLQDFMGGSHDSMVTLENRVRGLERVVEEMARDLALSSGRRGSNMTMGFEGSPGRSSSKFNGLSNYFNGKFGRGDGPLPFAERFLSSDGIISGVRGRDSLWRSDAEAWDPYAAPKNGIASSRRGPGGVPGDGRLSRSERDTDQISNRRAWDKGPGPFRLGEGPSARSVWQASKDEATLEAIRVAGEDSGTSRVAKQVAVPELDAETLGDANLAQDRSQLWVSWNHAMDSLHAGDMDSAYVEVLSTGDDLLLVKLMDRSGPVLDQLSNEIACEVLRAVGQFLLEQSLLDIALSWIQQLTDLVAEHGSDLLSLKTQSKRNILLSLHESSAMEPPEDWEGATAEQMMLQLASTWGISLQQLIK
uniref:Microtubule-associated protein TORTIFOLIA1 n=1 Tax=Anthurium amnicola TaxID=1678845 RepID=A0A1D1ZL44_9ARAE